MGPSVLMADSITNQNSLTKPFKTIQRALLESARFSYQTGFDNDITDKTILLFPGEHFIDNRPGLLLRKIRLIHLKQRRISSRCNISNGLEFALSLTGEFDLTVNNNNSGFNSVNGGVIVPRGTSLVGLDLRKTKIVLCMYLTPQMMMSPILLFSELLVTVLCLMERMILYLLTTEI